MTNSHSTIITFKKNIISTGSFRCHVLAFPLPVLPNVGALPRRTSSGKFASHTVALSTTATALLFKLSRKMTDEEFLDLMLQAVGFSTERFP